MTEPKDTTSSACICTADDIITPGTTISTDIYKTPPSRYVALAIRRVIRKNWWILALPSSICMCASAVDLRWLLVSLMIIFLIAPVIIARAFTGQLLTHLAQKAVSPKKIEITACERMIITSNLYEDAIPVIYNVKWSEISHIDTLRDGWLIHFHNFHGTGLYLPLNAINNIARPADNMCRDTVRF